MFCNREEKHRIIKGYVKTMFCCFMILTFINVQQVEAKTDSNQSFYVGGMPIGIYMETKGILVLGTAPVENRKHQKEEPAKYLVRPGDYILKIDQKKLSDKRQLMEQLRQTKKSKVTLQIKRKGQIRNEEIPVVTTATLSHKLGIWVRDSEQGIGTLSFSTLDGRFGALGHGISDTDTEEVVQIHSGKLYKTDILRIQKGKDGKPGGMSGIIVYRDENMVGEIDQNNPCGIYGTIDYKKLTTHKLVMKGANRNQIQVGAAQIRCYLDGKMSDYNVKIQQVNQNAKEENKQILLEVTDRDLLYRTGGIIQGMSGCPIIQNHRLVGAITHVFVQNSSKGYGISLESMLKNIN